MIRAALELRGTLDMFGGESLALTGTFAALSDLSGAFRETIEGWRRLITGELRGGYWLMPYGGRREHAPRHPFGTWRPQPTLLGPAYSAAWGGGAGSLTGITSRAAFFGVSGSRFPVAHLHRGGVGEIQPGLVTGKGILVSSAAQQTPWRKTKSRRNLTHPQNLAIWHAIVLARQVFLTGAALIRGLFVPFRVHATVNPQAAALLSAAGKRHLIRALGVTDAA